MVEFFFAGSGQSNENSFRNVDAFMHQNGFVLYTLTASRYSRAPLPAPFLYPALYQTVSGQPVWGDMIYLRDAASEDYRTVWAEDLSVTKLLKLACLYELFQLPDCAAELVPVYRDRLKTVVEPTILLNFLTPRLTTSSVPTTNISSCSRRIPKHFSRRRDLLRRERARLHQDPLFSRLGNS